VAASERDEAVRQQWRDDTRQLDVSRAVFVDESGTHLAMTPLYGRAPRRERALGRAPRNRGRSTTLVAALTVAGMGPAMTVEGGTDQAVFEAYVEQGLAPTLAPGQVVILDNVGAHLSRRARELIEARGAHVVFLPAYSPDLSPIELAFAKIKEHLRRAEARTREALEEAIAAALAAVTAADARGWFAHCGYPPPAQPL
jgi:transposase